MQRKYLNKSSKLLTINIYSWEDNVLNLKITYRKRKAEWPSTYNLILAKNSEQE